MDSLPSVEAEEKPQAQEEGQENPAEKPLRQEELPSKESDEKSNDDPYWWYLFSRKKVWVAVICAFLFLYFTGVMPADNVPILRSLARMMGYSSEEAKGMSFLKALLDWNEHSKRAKEEREREAENRRKTQQLAENNAIQTGKMLPSSLINWGSVNNLLLKQGQQSDDLTDVEQDKTRSGGPDPVALDDTKKGIGTDANDPANMEDVYFGTVTGGVERNKDDGYDSYKMLSKVNNPYQIDSSRHNWMGQAANNAFWAESGVADLLQQVAEQKGGGFAMHANIREIDDQRPRQDMYYAWITSRAGARTRNIWLMKTLASAGFLGADLDRQMLTIGIVGGVSFDENAVQVDLENVEKRIQFEKECNETLAGDGAQVTAGMGNVQKEFENLGAAFPSKCSDSVDDFIGKLNSIESACNQLNEGYVKLQKGCQLQYTQGSCKADSLRERITSFQTACEEAKKACDDPQKTDEEKQDCLNKVPDLTGDELSEDGEFSSSEIKGLIDGTTSVSTDENGHVQGDTFFPTTDWQNTLQNMDNMQ